MKISKLFHWLYAILMLLPAFAIGVTCAYAIFNKNAYQSYSGEQYQTETNIQNTDELRANNTQFTYVRLQNNYQNSANNYTCIYLITNFEVISSSVNITGTITKFAIITYSTNVIIELYDNNTQIVSLNSQNDTLNFKCIITGESNITASNNVIQTNYPFYTLQNDNNLFIDNVFYYSIDKVQQSPLFNWAEDSAIYTGMTTTCNALNITTTFIPLLMTYWLIISVIYILYDIILVILHIFHKKIHQLEDSF